VLSQRVNKCLENSSEGSPFGAVMTAVVDVFAVEMLFRQSQRRLNEFLLDHLPNLDGHTNKGLTLPSCLERSFEATKGDQVEGEEGCLKERKGCYGVGEGKSGKEKTVEWRGSHL
jgi:hypothetical protein